MKIYIGFLYWRIWKSPRTLWRGAFAIHKSPALRFIIRAHSSGWLSTAARETLVSEWFKCSSNSEPAQSLQTRGGTWWVLLLLLSRVMAVLDLQLCAVWMTEGHGPSLHCYQFHGQKGCPGGVYQWPSVSQMGVQAKEEIVQFSSLNVGETSIFSGSSLNVLITRPPSPLLFPV